MRHLCGFFACLLLLGVCAWGQEDELPPDPDDDIFRVDVNALTVRFSVRDSQNRFVNTLGQDAFRLFEDGFPQEILFFEAPRNQSGTTTGLWLSFLIDVSGSTFGTRNEQILAARTFFENLESFTKVGVFGFTDELIPFQDFTSDRRQALKALGEARRQLGRTAIYTSLNSLILKMQGVASAGERKVIIVISDGQDENFNRSAQSVSLARLNDVSIFTIQVPSAAQLYIAPQAPSQDAQESPASRKRQQQDAAFARLSRQTGGQHFSGFGAILDFDQTLAQITDSAFGNLYTLAFRTADRFRPKDERRVRIEVDGPYTASEPFSSLPQHLNVKKRFIAALFGDDESLKGFEPLFDYREIGAAIDLLKPRDGSQTGQAFRLKVNPLTLRVERSGLRTQLGIVGQLLDRDGKEVARLREVLRVEMPTRAIRQGEGFIYNNKILAPEGVYNFRLAVLEISTWKMTSFEKVVQIGG